MLQRFLYGFIAISTLFCVVLLDVFVAVLAPEVPFWHWLLDRGSIIPLAFTFIAVTGGVELIRLMRSAGLNPSPVVALPATALMMVSPWLSAAGVFGDRPSDMEGIQWQVVWLAATVIAAAFVQIRRGVSPTAIADLSATCLVPLYLGFMTSFLVQIRAKNDIPAADAAWVVLILLLVTKGSDIGAYLVGTTIGKHKLVPQISPAKSVEGAIGGLLASSAVSLIFCKCTVICGMFLPGGPISQTEGIQVPESKIWAALHDITLAFSSLSVTQAIIFGMLISASGQLGDLFESVFKRAARQKDSADVLPGFGGVLDLIDSPVMAAPVGWFLLTVCWGIL